MYRITNNGKGPRGVHSAAGVLVWIAPGASKVVNAANIATERKVPTLTIEPVGEVEAPPASLKAKLAEKPAVDMSMIKKELVKVAKSEGVDLDAGDNKADIIRKIEAARK